MRKRAPETPDGPTRSYHIIILYTCRYMAYLFHDALPPCCVWFSFRLLMIVLYWNGLTLNSEERKYTYTYILYYIQMYTYIHNYKQIYTHKCKIYLNVLCMSGCNTINQRETSLSACTTRPAPYFHVNSLHNNLGTVYSIL